MGLPAQSPVTGCVLIHLQAPGTLYLSGSHISSSTPQWEPPWSDSRGLNPRLLTGRMSRMARNPHRLHGAPTGEGQKTEGDICDLVMEVIASLRLYRIRHLAHEAKNH